MHDRSADTSVPIHPHLAARWSPRVFDPDAVVTGDAAHRAAGGRALGRHVG